MPSSRLFAAEFLDGDEALRLKGRRAEPSTLTHAQWHARFAGCGDQSIGDRRGVFVARPSCGHLTSLECLGSQTSAQYYG